MSKLDKLMSKAYQLKEDTYGNDGTWITPRDVRPIMWVWIVSLFTLLGAVIFIPGWNIVWVILVWLLLNYGFFNAQVKL